MLGANQDLMVLGLILLIGVIGAMGAAMSGRRDERVPADTGGRQPSTTDAVLNRPARSAAGHRHATERTPAQAPGPSAPTTSAAPKRSGPTVPARFNPDAYASLSRLKLASIGKHPDDHAGERVVFYGQITEFDSVSEGDGFLAKGGATQRWPAQDADRQALL